MVFKGKYDRVVGGYEGTVANRYDDLFELNVRAHRLAWRSEEREKEN